MQLEYQHIFELLGGVNLEYETDSARVTSRDPVGLHVFFFPDCRTCFCNHIYKNNYLKLDCIFWCVPRMAIKLPLKNSVDTSKDVMS